MSIASLYPSINPSLLLDFANVKRLDPRITFTRTTTATYYDGVTTAVAEQNLLTYSQEFDNAAWSKQDCTVGANATTAPDGTSTAESVVASNAVNSASGLYRSTPSVTTQSISFYVKAGNKTFAMIITNSGASGYNAWFNLGTGAVGTKGANITSSAIQSVGNSWYRISIILPYVGGNIGVYFTDADNSQTCTGNGSTVSGYVWGGQLEDRSSLTAYTATTSQAITNYIPVLQTASSGQARFDHNPTTGESLGLLIEEARTNQCLYSDDYTNAAWQTFNASKETTATVAPNGTLTACKIIATATSANHIAYQQITPSSTGVYATSIYVKAAGYNFACLRTSLDSDTKRYSVVVNLTNGAVTATQTNGATNTSYTVQDVGNGWYRVSVTASQSSGFMYVTVSPSDVSSPSFTNDLPLFTGNGFSGIFIWGAQLEAGSFATSYIPTVASTATRNADAASMTGTNFSSWFNNGEGTLFANFKTSVATGFPQAAFISDGSSNNSIGIDAQSGLRSIVTTLGVEVASFSASKSGSGDLVTLAYKVNDFGSSFNGAAAGTDTSGNLPVVSQFGIGQSYSSSNLLNGTIKKIAYYPIRVTNAQLQALTV